MEQKIKSSIEEELKLQSSNLGNYGPDDPVYAKALAAVTKLNSIVNEDEKLKKESENQTERLELEKQKIKDSKSLERLRLNLEKDKFDHQVAQDNIRNELERSKIDLEIKNIELNMKKIESDIEIARENARVQRDSDRNRLVITLIGTIGGLLIEGIAIAAQIGMGNKSLALEYVDNGITPKKTNEAIRCLNDFIKKKH